MTYYKILLIIDVNVKNYYLHQLDPYKHSSPLAACLALIALNLIHVVFHGPLILTRLFENLFALVSLTVDLR